MLMLTEGRLMLLVQQNNNRTMAKDASKVISFWCRFCKIVSWWLCFHMTNSSPCSCYIKCILMVIHPPHASWRRFRVRVEHSPCSNTGWKVKVKVRVLSLVGSHDFTILPRTWRNILSLSMSHYFALYSRISGTKLDKGGNQLMFSIEKNIPRNNTCPYSLGWLG